MFNSIPQAGQPWCSPVMTPWIMLPSLLGAASVLLIASVLLRRFITKRRRLRLRLLSGHSSLLGDEVERRTGSLGELDAARLDDARATAEAGLNDLHADLLDRQAHLQNYEDLAFLQGQKLTVLERSLSEARSDTGETAGSVSQADAAALAATPETGRETPLEHRDRLESDLLQRIEDLRGPGEGDPAGGK